MILIHVLCNYFVLGIWGALQSGSSADFSNLKTTEANVDETIDNTVFEDRNEIESMPMGFGRGRGMGRGRGFGRDSGRGGRGRGMIPNAKGIYYEIFNLLN